MKTIILVLLISFLPGVILLGAILVKNNWDASGLVCADADRYYNTAIFFAGQNPGYYLDSYKINPGALPWDVPLYALFLSVFFKLFNPGFLLAGFFNLLLFVLSVNILYRIGEAFFGKRAAFSAAVIFSLYPSVLIFNLLVLVEPLLLLLVLSGIYFFILYLKREKLPFLVLTAFFLGLSTLAKEVTIFLPLAMLALILFKQRKQLKKASAGASLLITVYLMTLAPLSIYNYNKFGDYMLSEKMARYFNFLSRQRTVRVRAGTGNAIKDYFLERKHFFFGTGTLSMLRVFGHDTENEETYWMMKEVKSPGEFLRFVRGKAGTGWGIYQALAWVFIACVYMTSFLGLFLLFLRKKYIPAFLISLMILYFLGVYYYNHNSRYFYSLTPFLSLLAGYYISGFIKER
ncbi:MAG: glycosyltransferase family 39 protein [Candidatus Omnitrophota bacterium]|jgi:4-amino-4-deoxy-L-arabinose transferase-like glycosyltransferase